MPGEQGQGYLFFALAVHTKKSALWEVIPCISEDTYEVSAKTAVIISVYKLYVSTKLHGVTRQGIGCRLSSTFINPSLDYRMMKVLP